MMTSSRFVSCIGASIVTAGLTWAVILTGCESTGPYAVGSLAEIKAEQRTVIYRNCIMDVFRENAFSPYIDPGLVIRQCARMARKRIPE